ncbi:kinase-like domain-containing protein [Phellopilus nigrolimitatus]|nr:kinase-like domain-containing protein [Phellopilus nigrolimitatus]
MATSTKRSAPRTPDGRPQKRRATSSPEDGELDDANASGSGQPGPSHAASVASGSSSKFRVPFPFKNKNNAVANVIDPLRDNRDRDRGRNRAIDRDRGRGREREWSQRPPAVYERSEEDERRFRGEDVRWDDRRPRDVSANSWRGTGDHYEPSSSARVSYYPPRDIDWERERGRERERERVRARSRDTKPYSPPRRDVPAPLRSPSRSRSSLSPSRVRSPVSRSLSPQSQNNFERQKHRLPTPRSTSLAVSPAGYESQRYSDDRDRERDRGDHYDPYGLESREYYRGRDRDHDPRGQYHREELEDWDRHYRPLTSHHDRDRERGRPRYSRSPAYRSPPRPAYNTLRSPDRAPPPPPALSPPPPPVDPEPPQAGLAPEALRVHQTVSFALKRPGAPLTARSPPSMSMGELKATPAAPAPITYSQQPATAEMPTPAVVSRKKRLPVKRTREEEKAAYQRVFSGCGRRDDYDIMTKLGEGTFGEVHKALHKQTRAPVALKRILMHNEKEGMPVTALREIKILKALKHPCIVELLDMFVTPSKGKDTPMSVYMVFPYMDHDLAGLLENERVKLTPSQIKLYMKQLLEGTEYMHHNNILHRDMKAANLLISNSGSLKIADFGLARAFDPTITSNPTRERKYTNCVVTRWYRPPELLLGTRQYGGEIDIWGIGCVLGEMFMRRPILPGNSDLDQLDKIWSICGSPNQQNWPDYDTLPGCEGQIRFRPQERRVKSVYDSLGKETCALLDRLLTLNPRERITATEALDHEYFWSDPLPADPKSLPTYESSHEFDQRGRRHQQPMPVELPKPTMNQARPLGLPPPLHNRNAYVGGFRNQNPHHQNFRNGGGGPYPPHMSGINNHFNVMPPSLPQPPGQHQLPPPLAQNPSWTSGPSRSANVSWVPNGAQSSMPRYGPAPPKSGERWIEGPQSQPQLPPRPIGLPLRPGGLPPMGSRGPPPGGPHLVQQRQPHPSSRYGGDSGPPMSGGALNYG